MPQIEQIDVSKGIDELMEDIENRDRIYSAVTHDVRSSLAAIKMIVETLSLQLDKELISPDIQEIVNIAKKSIDDTLVLHEDLLDWARYRYNDIIFRQEDILKLVNEVIKAYENIAAFQNISFNISFSDRHVVYVNKDMIKTCIRNLIGNALKFSPPNSIVRISVQELSDSVILSISDSGCGISDLNKDRLKSKKLSTPLKGVNLGLGLLLVKDFIVQNNGKLWFDSLEGFGSTFHISLPKFD